MKIARELVEGAGPFSLDISLTENLNDRGAVRKMCWGNMLVYVNDNGDAWVRLLDHSEFVPRDPVRAALSAEVAGFFDETDGPFAVRASDMISRDQAHEALLHWLNSGGKSPKLNWD